MFTGFFKQFQILKISFTILSLFLALTLGNSIVLAQTTNEINLKFPTVTQNQKNLETVQTSKDVWEFDGELTNNDIIKYSWRNVNLNSNFATKPAKNGGYLRVYNNSDDSEKNFLFNYGSSPLKIQNLKPFLKDGPVQLVFRYINSKGKVGARVVFKFRYKYLPNVNEPSIEIQKPKMGTIFTKNINYDFTINLKNFTLESINSNKNNKGQLRLYINQIEAGNLLDTFTFSSKISDNLSQVNFNSKDLSLDKKNIPDNQNAKLIFVLTRTNGELLPYQTEMPVITNFQNTLDIGLPKVTILDPDKNRTKLEIDGYRKFTLKIDNFKILKSFDSSENTMGVGYLQIFVDNSPVSTLYTKLDFTLYELGLQDLTEGRHVISVQLVNKNFTKLEPESKDSVDIIFLKSKKDSEIEVQNLNWRIYAILGIGILVVIVVAWFVIKS
jgi:hypothetical protein